MIKTNLMNLVEKALDGSSVKHTVISNNIANNNTPGFKKSQVSFQKALENSLKPVSGLKRTNVKHLQVLGCDPANIVQVQKVTDTSLRNDDNNVDIDMELASLAENNLYFNGLTQLLSSQLALLRHSISEGKR